MALVVWHTGGGADEQTSSPASCMEILLEERRLTGYGLGSKSPERDVEPGRLLGAAGASTLPRREEFVAAPPPLALLLRNRPGGRKGTEQEHPPTKKAGKVGCWLLVLSPGEGRPCTKQRRLPASGSFSPPGTTPFRNLWLWGRSVVATASLT